MLLKRIKIKKGNHYPTFSIFNLPRPILIKENETKTVQAEFMFTDSCLYDLKDIDQLDVNKLFGFSIGHHHKGSSFRFGWRPLIDKNTIEIVTYEYVDGVRQNIKPICEVLLNVWYKYSLTYDSKNGKVIYFVDRKSQMHTINPTKKHGWGYTLGTYIGGNETATHDIILFKIS